MFIIPKINSIFFSIIMNNKLVILNNILSIVIVLSTLGIAMYEKENLLKPILIILILVILSNKYNKKLDGYKFNTGILTWGLIGYVCSILYKLGYNIVALITSLFVIVIINLWSVKDRISFLTNVLTFFLVFITSLLL